MQKGVGLRLVGPVLSGFQRKLDYVKKILDYVKHQFIFSTILIKPLAVNNLVSAS